MDEKTPTLGFAGIGVGAIALMLALVHFWAGPFAEQPSMEEFVAEKAVSIRDATIAALKGEEIEAPPAENSFDIDRVLDVLTSVLGGLAVILGVIGFARKEPLRPATGAAVLGGGAIAFQFAALALGMIVAVLLISAVLDSLGIG